MKGQYLLNFTMNNGDNFDDHSIQNISIINSNNLKSKNFTPFAHNIINHWLRTDTNISTIIPLDICIIINKFYSLCAKRNMPQLVIFGCKGSKKLINEGDPGFLSRVESGWYSAWYLHQDIIDVDAVKSKSNDDAVIDLELMNTKQIQSDQLVAYEECGLSGIIHQSWS